MGEFNYGMRLKVVRLPSERLGVVDEQNLRVWIEQDLQSTLIPNMRSLDEVSIPCIPSHYGSWLRTSIGGVSSTVRRVGCLRASNKHKDPVTLFAVRCPTATCVAERLATLPCSVGDTETDDEFGLVNEVVVYDPKDVEHVASHIARTGSTPLLEDPKVNSLCCIGVERLDRIPSKALNDKTEEDYGLRRGSDNWRFPWMPESWKSVPITWDHLVQNMVDTVPVEDVGTIPQPLCQHVAEEHLRRSNYERVGTRWVVTGAPISRERSLGSVDRTPGIVPIVWTSPPQELKENPTEPINVPTDMPLNTVFQANDGLWYKPKNTRWFLEKHCLSKQRGKRHVSAALSEAQSQQLVEAFYMLVVERVQDPIVVRGLSLILFQYMKERGYTSRWMGKYVQDARHIGNGDKFRVFNRLSQYAPHRLPTEVLSKLCGVDGKLKNRGSKGSRSKYKPDEERYVPKRRLKRSHDDEERMKE